MKKSHIQEVSKSDYSISSGMAFLFSAKSCGEEQISIDPEISEWGNLAEQTSVVVT